VAVEEEAAGFCAGVLERFGAPDLVLNNAAIINPNAPLWETSAEDFSRIIDINIKGPAAMMRHLLPAMLKRGAGVIVNFSSGWGRCTAAEVAPYCATKYAIEGLSMATAQDTGGKVAVIGIIDTDMLRLCWPGNAASFEGPGDWARRVAPWLLRLDGSCNGHALTAPGCAA